MKEKDLIHGFEVKKVRKVDEIEAVAYIMEHQKTKAKLLWLDREDDNKTFSIAFKTIPTDDTGVFHILEHSVLNGSHRYPVKEPFVDLLKGSLQTFLNALTFPDKTVYPISSRNNQDFLNLMSVYLDAVFHPLCIESDNVFRQEGWHYELKDAKDDPIIKGVVYNEMQGAFSSSEQVAARTLMNKLFPDTSYGFESGGDPAAIPTLTYENFCAAHKKYYNATNARIFLDGKMDIDKVLAFINDEYLANMDYCDNHIEIKTQQPVDNGITVQEFESTTAEQKTIVSMGYVLGKFDDFEKTVGMEIISTLLCEDNQSLLKKAILDKQLAGDVYFTIENSIYQPYAEIMAINTDPDKVDEIIQTVQETLRKAVKDGLDKENIKAIINKMEFNAKERDFGGAPKGIAFDIQSLSTWLYDGDPVDGIAVDALYKKLKANVDTSFYEDLIEELILNSKHKAIVITKPSTTLEQQKREEMQKKMADYKKSLSPEQLNDLLEFNKRFAQWQKQEDTPEQKATLPKLTLKDIDEKPFKIESRIEKVNGQEVIRFLQNTGGINYYKAYFNVEDASLQQLQYLNMMCTLLGDLDTQEHTLDQLNMQIRNYLGSITAELSFIKNAKSDEYKTFVIVNYSCLKENSQKAWDLVKEIITETKFTDLKAISDIVNQTKNDLEQGAYAAGHAFGITRALAHTAEYNTCKEYTAGYEYYRFVKQLAENVDEKFCKEVKELYEKIFTANRLTLAVMSDEDVSYIINSLKRDDQKISKAERKVMDKSLEGVAIAANVSYAEVAVDTKKDLNNYIGQIGVISKMLSLDYLWTNVRAIGGAYGSGFTRRGNSFAFYSYRDPNPNNSIDIYLNSLKYLQDFVDSDADLLTYIIGAIGDSDPLLTNKNIIFYGANDYLSGTTYQQKCDIRQQILATSKQQIREMLPLFDFNLDDVSVCVVGSSASMDNCGEKVKSRLEL